jgi:hypothetical protein
MIGEDELRRLEGHVGRALSERSRAGLTILGHGEISLVLGWPFDRPRFACKRLPVFGDPTRVLRYREVFARYLAALRERGVPVLASELEWVDRPDGSVAAYVVQPVLPAAAMLPARLAGEPVDPRHPLVAAVIDSTVAAIDHRVGLDSQLSNWAEEDGDLVYFDVSTPLLRTEDGRAEIDLGVFLASYPWALRGALRRFVAPGVIARYHDARSSLLDLAGNLVKEGLRQWLPAVLEAINERVAPPISLGEVERDYAREARQWEVLLRLRKADRWWQARVRRRVYPFLLPGRTERWGPSASTSGP